MTCCVCQDNRFSGLASYHFGLVLRLSRLSNYWDYPDYTDRTSTIRLIRVIPRISYYLVSSPFNRLIKLYATVCAPWKPPPLWRPCIHPTFRKIVRIWRIRYLQRHETMNYWSVLGNCTRLGKIKQDIGKRLSKLSLFLEGFRKWEMKIYRNFLRFSFHECEKIL